MARRSYRRLAVEDRRRQLLTLGRRLFTEHAYDELSMAAVARAAGISKPLLYHYFPSKRDFFRAVLGEAAEELAARTEPDPALPPLEQLTTSLDAYLEWVEEEAAAYAKLMQSASSLPEVRELVETVRARTAARILAGLGSADPPPAMRAAVSGWLWFLDGACLDWLAHRDLERAELRDLLVATLVAALGAAGGEATGDREPAGEALME